jgi:ubiquinone/menaquinone biosynthesis C-methylase UbiE
MATTTAAPVEQLTLSELIAETQDPSLSMASGGEATVTATLEIAQIPPHGRYVEVGCAAGASAHRVALARPDVEVLGLDPQPAAIEGARITARAWGLTNTLYFVSDARDIPAADGTFDCLFLGNIPTFVPESDRAQVIRECMRVTKRTGWIIAVPMYYPGLPPDPQIAAEVERMIGAPIHRGREDYWLALYESHGLHLCQRRVETFRDQSDEELTAYVRAVMAQPANRRHDPERRAALGGQLLRVHQLFAANNVRLGYSILGYRLAVVSTGPYVLTPA